MTDAEIGAALYNAADKGKGDAELGALARELVARADAPWVDLEADAHEPGAGGAD